ncbi:hypothetical protein LSG31_02030 [Fodinisporobacter ferrooxydans]|uniref:Uncharacterized protein n=1 Tax=Fodinisporobacter ferrooxydans TaxID=2901836 RepID=A0ABY4CKM3_9BACL|nr:hypothetical protein LSG31_02030 [Alicyclobacillaceae bacterium MYW30-H2]
MFELMNTFMPRRRNNGMGMFTSMLVGATVGIAAWEVTRRAMSGNTGGQITDKAINQMADTVMQSLK